MSYGELITILLLLVILFQRGIKLSALKEIKRLMSQQEERLRKIDTKLATIGDGINTLQQQVEDLKRDHPELDDEISAIEGTVQRIADDLNPPAPDTGGGTGGGGVLP